METTLQTGIQHHRAGRLAEAAECYRQILSREPANADALHLSGVLALQRGDGEQAEDLLLKAIGIAPQNAEFHSNLGELYRRTGHYPEAIACYRRAIALDPGRPAFHVNLGLALESCGQLGSAITAFREGVRLNPRSPQTRHSLGLALQANGDNAEALSCFREALALDPACANGWNSLGNALLDAGHGEEAEAIAAFQRALAIQPNFPEAQSNLGTALWRAGRSDEAVQAFRQALRGNPKLASAAVNLAGSLVTLGEFDEALAMGQRAVALSPQDPNAYRAVGLVLLKLGRVAEARAAYRQALQFAPGSAELAFELAAIPAVDAEPGEAPAGDVRSTPAAHVRKLFDDYAGFFDQHLLQNLGYRVPAAICEEVRAVAGEEAMRNLEILDLGCGTGLCAAAFRPYARRIVGVDLSPKMVEVAKARGLYDELMTADLLDPLNANRGAFDLILAGDVLVYLGALEDLFVGVARALRPGGLFAFSVERLETGELRLLPTRRFAHSRNYLSSLAASHQLVERRVSEIPLRRGETGDIPGLILVLQKPVA